MRDVSLRSVRRFAGALTRSGSGTYVRAVHPTLLGAIRGSRPDGDLARACSMTQW